MFFHTVQDVSLKFKCPKQNNISDLVPLWLKHIPRSISDVMEGMIHLPAEFVTNSRKLG
jgi:hypothetical protein